MLDDSDRFAFIPQRIHSFTSTGNAYDAVQIDDLIRPGHTLLILPERVVGIAHTWPFAITADGGALHQLTSSADEGLEAWAASLEIAPADLRVAMGLAAALGFALDPAVSSLVGAQG